LIILDEVNEIKDSAKDCCFQIQKMNPNARYILFCSKLQNDFLIEFISKIFLFNFKGNSKGNLKLSQMDCLLKKKIKVQKKKKIQIHLDFKILGFIQILSIQILISLSQEE
jgi:hypothetical protein